MTEKQTVYHLEINGKGSHKSFEFSKLDELTKLFSMLKDKFNEHIITLDQARESDDFVQLTYIPVHLKGAGNRAASIVSEKLFSIDVYEEMLKAAKEFHESTK